MENCGFHRQLLSVMELLAKAAVAEIERRVEEGCSALRLEVSRGRRDIELLRRKVEAMEAELRRSRMRGRRKADRSSPLVRVVLNRQVDAEAGNQQCADEAEHALIKVESAEEDVWKSEDKLISEAEQLLCFKASQPAQTNSFVERHQNRANAGSLVSPTDGYDAFPEQQPNRNQNEAELVVKHETEEEPDENAAPLDSAHEPATEGGDEQLWSSNLCKDAVDPSSSYAGQQFEPVPSVFPSQSGLHLEDMVPRIHSVEKSHSAVGSAARVKRRVRTFGCKRPQQEEGHNAVSQSNMDQSSIPQQSQDQFRDSAAHTRNPSQDSTPPNTATTSLRGSFGLTRRMRTPWRSGIGEKRFSCTYCDKSFMRFSQLKEHLRSHTGEKPFSCLQCGRSFTKQCNLIRHAVVHSGEKPYECLLCGKCFTQRSSLKSHQKTAH